MNDNLSHIASVTIKNTFYLPSCHSTNTFLIDLLKQEKVEEGWMAYTFDQTNGRGQHGNSWESEKNKNLTFSVAFHPDFLPPTQQFYLNMAISLAIVKFIEGMGLKASIKWPNDIYINDKKICGILIENQIRGHVFSNSVVGIGLNINQTKFSNPKATSVCLEKNVAYDLIASLQCLHFFLMTEYGRLKNGDYEALKKEYHSYLYLRNKMSVFQHGGLSFIGTIKGVNEQGRLLVLTEKGMMDFGTKEISFKVN